MLRSLTNSFAPELDLNVAGGEHNVNQAHEARVDHNGTRFVTAFLQ